MSRFVALVVVFVVVCLPVWTSGARGNDGTLDHFRQSVSWFDSYSSLIAKVEAMPEGQWSVALDFSDDPREKATVSLRRESPGGFLLTSRYKQQAIDPDTGQRPKGVFIDVVMKIRDRNLDGIPDEFRGEPFDPYPGEEVLDNGFIRIRDSTDHESILIQWDTFIAMAVKALAR